MNLRFFRRLIAGAAVCITLTACGNDEPKVVLPEGVQTFSGVLLRAELSLVRRGSHILRIDGEDTYFVESSKLNLQPYEKKEVELEGTLEFNVSDEYLPVFIVDRIVSVIEQKMKHWDIHSIGIGFDAPETWAGKVESGKALLSVAGSPAPVISIFAEKVAEDDEEPVGMPVVVGNERGVRQVDEVSGAQKIIVSRDDERVIFIFDPSDIADADIVREQWLALLNSVVFAQTFTQSTGTGTSTGTGSYNATGSPCGGPAGILCPEGYFCNITHMEENIGQCAAI